MNFFTGLLIATCSLLACQTIKSEKPSIKITKATQLGLNESGKANKFLHERIDKYDEEGKINTQEYYNEHGVLTSSFKYIYSGDELVKFVEYDVKGLIIAEYTREYEPHTKLVITKITNGLLEKKTLMEFEGENITQQTVFDKGGDIIQQTTNEYNTKNQLVKKIEKYSKTVYDTWIYWYEYDEKGNLIRQKWTDEIGFILTTTTYIYEFDQHQNWTKKEVFEDNKIKYVFTRDFEYF